MFIIPASHGITLHTVESGPKDGPPVVFAHALGSDLTMWDTVVDALPDHLRLIRMDMRGHGQSPCPEGPYPMGDLVGDAGTTLDALRVKGCVFVGLSIGGIIAQGLAAERLDLVRGMVISNTAAKIGTPWQWEDRIKAVRDGGIDANIERWFSRTTARDHPELLEDARTRMRATPLQGYLGCMEAIADTDLYESTAALRLPTLAIAGTEDGSTPADMVRETAGLIPGSRFELIRGTGHMSPVEKPAEYAALLTDFLRSIGHV
ncbi:3-oxoadipate enol-lactonase [Aliiroseovarius halocynthiae]|uniref:3-oxoadipate enol-lactonase n=1 Tax=Aliiroseovarius halocynthiae TaxID=985055 RepID=A0A545SYD8_9RHOB|nr:3-oxoadipate enol-lactonase [Aliiroseovarius halocynthiae]TQV69978.1 3-oxoadipate enol-lactonase [Aliiroseovarius halocynthiae]SMR70643.1 3-oxoadipate enol-lactonase [Aliiroseovarius halocynthiae]